MTEEWIKHDGKGYPDLPLDTRVQVRFADGEEDDWTVEEAGILWRWEDAEPWPEDITHYRVVQSDE